MSADDPSRTRLTGWGIVGRIVFVILALPVLAFWGLFALAVWAFRCDENCRADQVNDWQWTGQVVLAGAGILIALIALALSFTRHRTTFWTMLLVVFFVALAWIMWNSNV